MRIALDLFSLLAIGAGVFFFFAGTVALLRFPDSLSRLHALTKADNLGLGLVVLGAPSARRRAAGGAEAYRALGARAAFERERRRS